MARYTSVRFVVLMASIGGLLAGHVCATEQITVRLTNGRLLTGQPHQRTDDTQLWLRFGDESAWILQPVPWSMIRTSTSNGLSVTRQELQELGTRAAASRVTDETPRRVTVRPVRLTTPEPTTAQKTERASAPRAQSVRVQASVDDWDADPQADGVRLRLVVLDASSRPVPVSGYATIRLLGLPQGRRGFNASPQQRRDEVAAFARWTRTLKTDGVDVSGSDFKLPFRSQHPDRETNWGDFGLLHVRVVLPGQGVLETSLNAVELRGFDPIRDAYERRHKRRLLPVD